MGLAQPTCDGPGSHSPSELFLARRRAECRWTVIGLTPAREIRARAHPPAVARGRSSWKVQSMPVLRRTFARTVTRTVSDALARVSITRSGIILSAICVMFLALIGRVAYL